MPQTFIDRLIDLSWKIIHVRLKQQCIAVRLALGELGTVSLPDKMVLVYIFKFKGHNLIRFVVKRGIACNLRQRVQFFVAVCITIFNFPLLHIPVMMEYAY